MIGCWIAWHDWSSFFLLDRTRVHIDRGIGRGQVHFDEEGSIAENYTFGRGELRTYPYGFAWGEMNGKTAGISAFLAGQIVRALFPFVSLV